VKSIVLPIVLLLAIAFGSVGCTSKPPDPPKSPDGDDVEKKQPTEYNMDGVKIR
jgi:hypothetical protein